jgi:hypothetical protein
MSENYPDPARAATFPRARNRCRTLAETRQGPKSCAVPELAKPVKRPDFEVVDRLVLVEAVNQDRVSRKPLRNAGLGPGVVTT